MSSLDTCESAVETGATVAGEPLMSAVTSSNRDDAASRQAAASDDDEQSVDNNDKQLPAAAASVEMTGSNRQLSDDCQDAASNEVSIVSRDNDVTLDSCVEPDSERLCVSASNDSECIEQQHSTDELHTQCNSSPNSYSHEEQTDIDTVGGVSLTGSSAESVNALVSVAGVTELHCQSDCSAAAAAAAAAVSSTNDEDASVVTAVDESQSTSEHDTAAVNSSVSEGNQLIDRLTTHDGDSDPQTSSSSLSSLPAAGAAVNVSSLSSLPAAGAAVNVKCAADVNKCLGMSDCCVVNDTGDSRLIANDSQQHYISALDINNSSTQPLKSLADLVQKVSISASPRCDNMANKNVCDVESAAAVRNSPMYCGRVGYMSTYSSSQNGLAEASNCGGNTALQHSTEYSSSQDDFKKPSASARQLNSNSNDQCNAVEETVVCCNSRQVDSHGADESQRSPPSVEYTVPTHKHKDKQSSTARNKNRVTKCKVDVVDVKFLKDLIVACGNDRTDGVGCKLASDESSLTANSGSDTTDHKPPHKQRKSAALQRKTTKLLSDITLIDVAAVKSCVEKDYSEFIKSIQQSHDVNELKSKKKKKAVVSTRKLAVSGEVNRKKVCSSRSRQSRKQDNSSGQEVTSRTLRQKKKENAVLVNKHPELPANVDDGSVIDISSVVDQTDRCQTSTKKRRQKKKKTSSQELESEVVGVKNVTETGVDCRSEHSQQASIQPVAGGQNMENAGREGGMNSTVDECSIPSALDTPVIHAKRAKKSKSSKKKSAALFDIAAAASDGNCASTNNSESIVTSNTVSQSPTKHSRTTADSCALEPSASGNVSNASDLVSTQTSQITGDVKPPRRKDHRQKKKKKKKTSYCEAQSELASGMARHEKIVDEVPQVNSLLVETMTDSDDKLQECGQVTAAVSQPLNSDVTTSAHYDDVTTPAHYDDVLQTATCDQVVDDVAELSLSATLHITSTVDVSAGACLVAEAAGTDEDEHKLFACRQCSYKARKKGQLRKHLSVHKLFYCAHCEFSTDTQGGLDEHMSVKHPSRCGRRLCKRCHMLFRAGKPFTDHVEQCTGVKCSWQCPTCGKNFKFISAMRTHVRRWHDNTNTLPATAECSTNVQPMSDNSVSLPLPATSVSSAAVPTDSTVEPSNRPQQTASQLPPPPPSSSSSSSSAVTVDGQLRYACDHCPKLFKARRSMVHHRRMIHEGGRLRKKEAAAAAAAAAEKTIVGDVRSSDGADGVDAEKTTVGDARSSDGAGGVDMKTIVDDARSADDVRSSDDAAAAAEKTAVGDVRSSDAAAAAQKTTVGDARSSDAADGGDAEKSTVNDARLADDADDTVTQLRDAVINKASTSSAAAAARPVYSCSFAGCSQTFKRDEQLRRHEEKHAGPGL